MKALERVKQVRHPFVLSIEQIQDVGGELVIVMELADKNLHDCLVEYQQAGRPGIPRDILLGFLRRRRRGARPPDREAQPPAPRRQAAQPVPRRRPRQGRRLRAGQALERSSSSGLMGGVTPIYAAPETFSNKISKHSDQYSLAIVYVELLTGQAAVPRQEHPAARAPAHDRAAGPVDAAGGGPAGGRAGAGEEPGRAVPELHRVHPLLLGGRAAMPAAAAAADERSGSRTGRVVEESPRTSHDVDLTPTPRARPAAASR